jgi:quercetin dioxygenase-like cupin family protein
MAITAAAHSVSYGSILTFEDLDATAPQPRMRAAEQTLLRVVAGCVGLGVEGVVRLLEPGDEAIIAAGEAHTVESIGGPARILTGFRPAAAR